MGVTVTRAYLAEKIHETLGISRSEATEIVDQIFLEMGQALKDVGVLKLSSFGSFRTKRKKPRIGRNPKTMKEAVISERLVVGYYPSKLLKKQMNMAYSSDNG